MLYCCSYGSEEEAERQGEGEGEGGSTTVAELQLTDWESLACLLCKRQFPVGAPTVCVGRVSGVAAATFACVQERGN
jgi:hypothetical protein